MKLFDTSEWIAARTITVCECVRQPSILPFFDLDQTGVLILRLLHCEGEEGMKGRKRFQVSRLVGQHVSDVRACLGAFVLRDARAMPRHRRVALLEFASPVERRY